LIKRCITNIVFTALEPGGHPFLRAKIDLVHYLVRVTALVSCPFFLFLPVFLYGRKSTGFAFNARYPKATTCGKQLTHPAGGARLHENRK
jgi:hypothetical protein